MVYHQDWRQRPYAPGHVGAGVLAVAGSTPGDCGSDIGDVRGRGLPYIRITNETVGFSRGGGFRQAQDSVGPLVLSQRNPFFLVRRDELIWLPRMFDNVRQPHLVPRHATTNPSEKRNQQQPATVAALKEGGRATTSRGPVIGHERYPAKPTGGKWKLLLLNPPVEGCNSSIMVSSTSLACGCLLLMRCSKVVPVLVYC